MAQAVALQVISSAIRDQLRRHRSAQQRIWPGIGRERQSWSVSTFRCARARTYQQFFHKVMGLWNRNFGSEVDLRRTGLKW